MVARPRVQRLHARPALHEVQFCRTSDDVRIAYARLGNGPPVVWAAHWLSHLAFSWESPIWRHWTEEFAMDHAFVHYDERGNDCQTGTTRRFLSMRSCAISKRSSTHLASIGSR